MGLILWLVSNSKDVRTVLLFVSSIIWLVFFVDAVPWRNLKSLRGKYMLMFLISMYFIQFLSLLFFAYWFAYSPRRDEYYVLVTFFNWFVWLVNTIASREAKSRGYKKRGIIGVKACLIQLVVYLIVFFYHVVLGMT